MRKYQNIASILLRLSISFSFLVSVSDRLGWWGKNGTKGVTCGDWQHFVNYLNVIFPYLSSSIINILALFITIIELSIAVLLVFGTSTKLAALMASLTTLIFALLMAITMGIKAPFNYSIFVLSTASFLLSTLDEYPCSLDALIAQSNNNFKNK